jgi:hypothetical protein
VNHYKFLKNLRLKMAVPAQEERYRGAIPASGLARAGAINVRALDDLSCDRLTFGLANPHPQRDALYTSCLNCQRFFVTNSTKFIAACVRLTPRTTLLILRSLQVAAKT